MKNSLRFISLLAALALSFAQYATAATLTGIVSNEATGTLLEAATVEVQPINIITRTDQIGRFDVPRLPYGTYQVTVSYTDLETQTKTVELTAENSSASLNFPLTSKIYQLETFVVAGEREGHAASIARQQAAENVKTVVAIDSYGFLANDNPADLLIRLPGITGNIDEDGNIASINIRGIDSSMNVVTFDGAQMATSAGLSSRAFRFYNINASTFEELEVIKAPTPKDDAGSLGGTVNMKTKSTLNMKGNRLITYQAGIKIAPSFFDYNPRRQDDPYAYNLAVGYKQIFSVFGGRRNLGLSFDYSHNENVSAKVQTTMLWGYSLADPTYISDVYYYDQIGQRTLDSGTLRFDYQFNKNNRIYLSTMILQSRETPNNGDEAYNVSIRANTPYATYINSNYTNSYTQFNYGRLEVAQGWVGFYDLQSRLQLGGEHVLGNWKIDYDLTYSGSRVDLNGNEGRPESGKRLTMTMYGIAGIYDTSASLEFPSFTQVGGAGNVTIPNDYLRNGNPNNTTYAGPGASGEPVVYLQDRQGTREADNYEGHLNAQTAISIFGQPVQITTGVAWRSQALSECNKTSRWRFRHDGDLTPFVYDDNKVDPRFGSITNIPRLDIHKLSVDLIKNPNHWEYGNYLYANGTEGNYTEGQYYYINNYRAGTYDLKEKVSAGYIMARTRFEKLGILAGVRFENTRFVGHAWKRQGNATDTGAYRDDPVGRANANYGTAPVEVRNDYNNYLPSVHFTYSFNKQLLARASWSTAMARANPKDLVPNVSINDTDERVTSYNDKLVPQYANNFDLSLEYYTKPAGLISVGVFRKQISDFIYTTITKVPGGPDNGFGGAYEGYDLYTKYNGASATVDGIELSYSQDLRFLPKPFDGFNLRVNYTLLKTEGDYGTFDMANPYAPRTLSTNDVPGFIPSSINARLSYRYKDFSTYASLNYTDEYLLTYSTDPSRLIYREARTTIDVGVAYRLFTWAELNFVISNVTDEPIVAYMGKESHRRYTIYNGPGVNFTVRGRF